MQLVHAWGGGWMEYGGLVYAGLVNPIKHQRVQMGVQISRAAEALNQCYRAGGRVLVA